MASKPESMKLLIAEILGRHVLARGNDLELLQLRRDVRLRRVGLGGLDHLDAPGVGDIAVGERDPVRPLLLRVLEELGLRGPRGHAAGIGGWTRDDFRRRQGSDRRRRQDGRRDAHPGQMPP